MSELIISVLISSRLQIWISHWDFFLGGGNRLFPSLPHLCKLFNTWGGICVLPGSKTRTCGSCPASADSSGWLQPPDKWFFLPFVCRYNSAHCQVWVNRIVPNLHICLLLFPNSGWWWLQGHCGAAGQTWCRGKQDTHCFLLDLPSSSCLWSNYSNHKRSCNIWKKSAAFNIYFFLVLRVTVKLCKFWWGCVTWRH